MNNPVSENWYADPESRVFGDTVYMYVTRSIYLAVPTGKNRSYGIAALIFAAIEYKKCLEK